MKELAKEVVDKAREKKLMLATAESCTGGLLSAILTDIPGASKVFDRGFITYSNEAKVEMLGVGKTFIEEHGAVSEQVACAMAEGAVRRSKAQMAVGITGLAGPGGETAEKPIGLVHIALWRYGGPALHRRCNFTGTREEIRQQSVETALKMLLEAL